MAKLSDEQHGEIILKYKKGVSVVDLASEYDISKPSIYRIMKKKYTKYPKKKLPKVDNKTSFKPPIITDKLKGKYKFDEKMINIILNAGRNGESKVEVCAKLGITRVTFYKWIKNCPEFKEIIDEYLVLSESYWQNLAMNIVKGEIKTNAQVFSLMMSTRFGLSQNNKIELDAKVDAKVENTQIHNIDIETLQNIQDLLLTNDEDIDNE